MLNLQIITVSTRQGRSGHKVAAWFTSYARQHAKFEIEEVDLAQVNLPLYDEPTHPRFQKYEHDHTKAWSKIVQRADAFVFVTPEYNFAAPPSLLNALDYLNKEWAYKPAGFVSYGGVSAGTRSVQMAKQIVTSLGIMPIPQAVAIPFFAQHINKETGVFDPGSIQETSAGVMLNELLKWATALKPLHHPAPETVTETVTTPAVAPR